MRGKKTITPRVVLPDVRFHSEAVSRFINSVMLRGQRLTAMQAVYGAFDKIEKELKQPPLPVFETALKNVAPLVEVRSKRIGGATYQVPVEVRPERKRALAIRWIINAARASRGQIDQKLATELMSAFKNEGTAIKKRDEVHRMAEANKAFAHYARF
jgi:small subunit ribosomal protein S7